MAGSEEPMSGDRQNINSSQKYSKINIKTLTSGELGWSVVEGDVLAYGIRQEFEKY